MTQQAQSRKQIEAALIAKAQSEPVFRKALLNKPKAAIEKEFGVTFPAGGELTVVEETASTNYLVLPALDDGELSDEGLEAVAGGSHFDPVLKSGLGKITSPCVKKEKESEDSTTEKISL